MNLIEKINKNRDFLSPQEVKVCDYILNNIANYKSFSIKFLANKLKVQPSVISHTLYKLEIGGLKQLIKILENNFNFYKSENQVFSNNLVAEFKKQVNKTFNSLNNDIDINLVKKVVDEMLSSKKIILFCTGKTKILVSLMFFWLLELNLRVELYSNLFDHNAYDVNDACVVVVSASGNNSKINRYLNLINNKNYRSLIAITSSTEFKCDIKPTYHLHGSQNHFFLNDNKTTPIIEKYKIQYIMDLLFLTILNEVDLENIKFQEKTKTTNVI